MFAESLQCLVMWLILAENAPKPLVAWLMMALVALLIVGILFAWLLGRLMGPKANWGKPLTGKRNNADESPVDVWEESARRMKFERDEDDRTS